MTKRTSGIDMKLSEQIEALFARDGQPSELPIGPEEHAVIKELERKAELWDALETKRPAV